MEGKGLMEGKIVDGQKSVAGMIFSPLREDSRRPQRIPYPGWKYLGETFEAQWDDWSLYKNLGLYKTKVIKIIPICH